MFISASRFSPLTTAPRMDGNVSYDSSIISPE